MFPFDPPENIRKPQVDQKGTLESKGLITIVRQILINSPLHISPFKPLLHLGLWVLR